MIGVEKKDGLISNIYATIIQIALQKCAFSLCGRINDLWSSKKGLRDLKN